MSASVPHSPSQLCVIIPTLDAASCLPTLLPQINGAEPTAAPLKPHIIISDGGSTDHTLAIALTHGASLAVGQGGRGQQLSRGGQWATARDGAAPWLLFLHADSRLPQNWHKALAAHMTRHPRSVGYFRYRANTPQFWGRIMDFWVGMRSFWWRLPYGDQGLLISAAMYAAIGGYRPMELFEDVDMVDRLKAEFGGRVLRPLNAKITTDVSAYQRDGWWSRARRNMKLLKAYRGGMPIEALTRQYQ